MTEDELKALVEETIDAWPDIDSSTAKGVKRDVLALVTNAVLTERREIMKLIGLDESGKSISTPIPGTVNQYLNHDAYYELEGALIDLERNGADQICIDTIERVQRQLAEVGRRAMELT